MRSRTLSKITPDGKYEVQEEVPDIGNIAYMGKHGVSPALFGGDTYFFAGKGTLADQFKGSEDQLEYLVAQAKRKGYNPNPNDVYTPALAQYPGDPAAFVPPSGGLNHIKHICEERDLSCGGAFKRERKNIGEKEVKPVIHRKIFNRLKREMIAADESLGRKSKREIKEAVYAKHAYKPE
jgi:hypothetical protein